jgi:hypothetical protein
LKLQQIALDAIHFDLTSIPLSQKERGFEAYSPTLALKKLGVKSVFHAIENRYMFYCITSVGSN